MKKYKVVIVGGGSTWTPGLLKSLCEKKNEFPMEELRMYDINAERQAVIGEFAKILFAGGIPGSEVPVYHRQGPGIQRCGLRILPDPKRRLRYADAG